MNIPIKFLSLLLTTSLLFTQCRRDEDEIDKLPPATASGLGTFGCLMNGKAWPIYEKGFHYVEAYYSNNLLVVGYYVKENELALYYRESVKFTIKNIQKPGDYIVSFNTPNGYCSATKNYNMYSSDDPINKNGFAWVNITRLDTVYGFVAGSFGFTLLDDGGLTSVKIESGRFDISY